LFQTLTNHYSPQVARLSKVFFEDNMPKKEHEMDKFIGESYQSVRCLRSFWWPLSDLRRF
jgi:hypothetical protein